MNLSRFDFISRAIGTAPPGEEFSACHQAGFAVPNQKDKQDPVELTQLNAKLMQGLKSCRKLLVDYRSKLAANGNVSEAVGEDSQETRDSLQGPQPIGRTK